MKYPLKLKIRFKEPYTEDHYNIAKSLLEESSDYFNMSDDEKDFKLSAYLEDLATYEYGESVRDLDNIDCYNELDDNITVLLFKDGSCAHAVCSFKDFTNVYEAITNQKVHNINDYIV